MIRAISSRRRMSAGLSPGLISLPDSTYTSRRQPDCGGRFAGRSSRADERSGREPSTRSSPRRCGRAGPPGRPRRRDRPSDRRRAVASRAPVRRVVARAACLGHARQVRDDVRAAPSGRTMSGPAARSTVSRSASVSTGSGRVARRPARRPGWRAGGRATGVRAKEEASRRCGAGVGVPRCRCPTAPARTVAPPRPASSRSGSLCVTTGPPQRPVTLSSARCPPRNPTVVASSLGSMG